VRAIVWRELHVGDPDSRVFESEGELNLKRARAQNLCIGYDHGGQVCRQSAGRRDSNSNQNEKE
jgi:hypothetical protein